MQNEIIERLSNEYTKARAKNPSYSLRAFSNRLGIQVSALSEILNGKRVISKKKGKKNFVRPWPMSYRIRKNTYWV